MSQQRKDAFADAILAGVRLPHGMAQRVGREMCAAFVRAEDLKQKIAELEAARSQAQALFASSCARADDLMQLIYDEHADAFADVINARLPAPPVEASAVVEPEYERDPPRDRDDEPAPAEAVSCAVDVAVSTG